IRDVDGRTAVHLKMHGSGVVQPRRRPAQPGLLAYDPENPPLNENLCIDRHTRAKIPATAIAAHAEDPSCTSVNDQRPRARTNIHWAGPQPKAIEIGRPSSKMELAGTEK